MEHKFAKPPRSEPRKIEPVLEPERSSGSLDSLLNAKAPHQQMPPANRLHSVSMPASPPADDAPGLGECRALEVKCFNLGWSI